MKGEGCRVWGLGLEGQEHGPNDTSVDPLAERLPRERLHGNDLEVLRDLKDRSGVGFRV